MAAYRDLPRLLKIPAPWAEIAQSRAAIRLLDLSRNHLPRGLTTAERASCFLHHYRRLSSALPERGIDRAAKDNLALHESA